MWISSIENLIFFKNHDMKIKLSILTLFFIAIVGGAFYLFERRELNEWDISSDKGMYTFAIVYTQINRGVLEEIKGDVRASYHFDKAGEGLFCFNQKWRNAGFIRLNFIRDQDNDLLSESKAMKKDIGVLLQRHKEIIVDKMCIVDEKGNKY